MKQLVIVIAMLIPVEVMAEWKVPPNPSPEVINDEARTDARAGRYEDALAKHLWFHHNALQHDSSLAGVRLVPALMGWYELGKVYPPSLEKLKETRDDADRQVRKGEGDVRQAFHDMSSINEQLGDEEQTAATFVWLNKNLPDVAKEVYDDAQPSLIKAKKFTLCGKYLAPDAAFKEMVELYELDQRFAQEQTSQADKQLEQEIAELWLMRRAVTLVALLVLNDRKPEAEKIAESIRSKSKYPNRDKVIDAALEGKFPELKFE